MKERLLKEVLAPCWYAIKSLGSILTSEEALYAYVSFCITLICFLVEFTDELVNTTRWALGSLVDLGEPEVCEMYVDENLYLMPSHDTWEILGAEVEEIVAWWQGKASQRFNEVVDVAFWSEGWGTQLEGRELTALPPYRKRVGVKFIG